LPIRRKYTTRNGKKIGYYQFGSKGRKYYYTPGNPASRKRAYRKARKQAAAIHS